MIDCLFGALAQAVPEKVTADSMGGSTLPTDRRVGRRQALRVLRDLHGHLGCRSIARRTGGRPHMGANQSNVPVEMIESGYPLRIVSMGSSRTRAAPASIAAAYRSCASSRCWRTMRC
jgi:N-methylhydantoinase B